MTYKVYKKGNFLEVVDTNNGQIYNARLADARIKRHDTSNVWYDFYKDGEKFLSKIFLNQIVDENDASYSQQDFEDFIYCSFGKTVIGDSCEGLFNIPQDGQDGADGQDGVDSIYPNVGQLAAKIKVSQTGTNAPAEQYDFYDTISGTWSRESAGIYHYTDASIVSNNKVFIQVCNGTLFDYPISVIPDANNSRISFYTRNDSGVLSDNIMVNASILIEIYP